MIIRSKRGLGIACGVGVGLLCALLAELDEGRSARGGKEGEPLPAARGAETPAGPSSRSEPRAEVQAEPCAPALPCPPRRRVPVTLGKGRRALEVVPFEVLVELRPSADEEAWLRAASGSLGARLEGRAGGALRLSLPEDGAGAEAVSRALTRLSADPRVAWAGPNAVARGAGREKAAKPGASWNLRAVDAPTGDLGGAVAIAILDSGLALGGADGAGRAPFLGDVAIVSPADFVDDDSDPADGSGHGTHVASVLVGERGLARGAALVPVRVLDDDLVGTEASLILGLEHAVASGADVVNLSLAFSRGYFPSPALDRAFAAALRAGVVLVAASGNDGEDEVRFPAAFPGVLAVGATRIAHGRSASSLEPAGYSSHGPELDLLAPGGDLDTDVDRDGLPDGILGTSFDPGGAGRFEPWLFAGTSQAAAHASAAAAHLVASGLGADEVAPRLRALARPLPGCSPGFDSGCGAGALHLGAGFAAQEGGEGREGALEGAGIELAGRLEPLPGGRRARVLARVRDAAGAPAAGVTLHARWRGAASGQVGCVTDELGVCALSSAPLAGPLAAVSLEVAALSRPGSGATRPADLYALGEVAPFLEALAAGEAEAPVWLEGEGEASTFALRGFATSTALPPQIVLLDAGAFGKLAGLEGEGLAGGTGFGSSSMPSPYFLLRMNLATFAAGGAGFGSSSLGALILWGGTYDLKLSTSTYTYALAAGSASLEALEQARFTPGPLLEAAGENGEPSVSTEETDATGKGVPAP